MLQNRLIGAANRGSLESESYDIRLSRYIWLEARLVLSMANHL